MSHLELAFGVFVAMLVTLLVGWSGGAEPAPEPPACQLLAANERFELYRCSGAGFERSCYVAVAPGRMAATLDMEGCR